MVLWSAQGMSVAQIARLGVDQRGPGRERLAQLQRRRLRLPVPPLRGRAAADIHAGRAAGDQEDRQVQAGRARAAVFPVEPGQAADFLVAEGVVDDISHEGLRELLRAENVSFQAVKTWKASADPDYAAKKARVDYLYAIADGEAADGEAAAVATRTWSLCLDEFGPLNLQPRPGRASARARAAPPASRASRRGGGCGRPITGPAGCGTCSPRWSWAATRCTGTSRSASGAASSWSSAATCAACTRRLCGSRSSAITTART